MKTRTSIAALLLVAMVAGCAHPGQNRYDEQDVGMNAVVEFGTIISEREVDITGKNTGTGGAIGLTAGAAVGSQIGRGNGSLAGTLAGAIVGGIAGSVAEQAMQDRKGIEYIVTLHDGKTESIVQNIAQDDVPLHKGQRVMVQTQGQYRRVLPADDLPTEIKRPKHIKVKD